MLRREFPPPLSQIEIKTRMTLFFLFLLISLGITVLVQYNATPRFHSHLNFPIKKYTIGENWSFWMGTRLRSLQSTWKRSIPKMLIYEYQDNSHIVRLWIRHLRSPSPPLPSKKSKVKGDEGGGLHEKCSPRRNRLYSY